MSFVTSGASEACRSGATSESASCQRASSSLAALCLSVIDLADIAPSHWRAWVFFSSRVRKVTPHVAQQRQGAARSGTVSEGRLGRCVARRGAITTSRELALKLGLLGVAGGPWTLRSWRRALAAKPKVLAHTLHANIMYGLYIW